MPPRSQQAHGKARTERPGSPASQGSWHYTSASQCITVGKRTEDGEDVDNGPPEGFGGEIYEALSWRGFREGEKKMKKTLLQVAGDLSCW